MILMLRRTNDSVKEAALGKKAQSIAMDGWLPVPKLDLLSLPAVKRHPGSVPGLGGQGDLMEMEEEDGHSPGRQTDVAMPTSLHSPSGFQILCTGGNISVGINTSREF